MRLPSCLHKVNRFKSTRHVAWDKSCTAAAKPAQFTLLTAMKQLAPGHHLLNTVACAPSARGRGREGMSGGRWIVMMATARTHIRSRRWCIYHDHQNNNTWSPVIFTSLELDPLGSWPLADSRSVKLCNQRNSETWSDNILGLGCYQLACNMTHHACSIVWIGQQGQIKRHLWFVSSLILKLVSSHLLRGTCIQHIVRMQPAICSIHCCSARQLWTLLVEHRWIYIISLLHGIGICSIYLLQRELIHLLRRKNIKNLELFHRWMKSKVKNRV